MINCPFPPFNNNNNNRDTNFSRISNVNTRDVEHLFTIGALLQLFSVALFSVLRAPADSIFCNGGKRDERLIGTLAGVLSTSANWNWRWLQLLRRGVFTGHRSLPSSGLNLFAGDKWICQFSSAFLLWILTPFKFVNFNSCGNVMALITPNTSLVLSSRTANSQMGDVFRFTSTRKPAVSQFFQNE